MCAAAVAWRVHMNLCSIRYENGGYISLPVQYQSSMYGILLVCTQTTSKRKTNGERRPWLHSSSHRPSRLVSAENNMEMDSRVWHKLLVPHFVNDASPPPPTFSLSHCFSWRMTPSS